MSNTLTNIRLRELLHAAEDQAADTSQPVASLQIARDTATAIAELIDFRVKLAALVEREESLRADARAPR